MMNEMTKKESVLGQLSLILGIALTVLNIAWFYYKYTDHQMKMDDHNKLVIEARPRFDVLYYEMNEETISAITSINNMEERTFDHPTLGKPIVKTAIFNKFNRGLEEQAEKFSPFNDNPEQQTIATNLYLYLLSIRNVGARRAEKIAITFRKFNSTPDDPLWALDLSDIWSLTTDRPYTEIKLALNDLNSMDGVLVPIFSQAKFTAGDEMPAEAIVGELLVPDSIEYFDSVEERNESIPVRKMLDVPIYIKAGVSSRG